MSSANLSTSSLSDRDFCPAVNSWHERARAWECSAWLACWAIRARWLPRRSRQHSSQAPKRTHFPARAKHVIHIYLNGGPSQIDTFDPKPALARYAGQRLPTGNLSTERPTGSALPSPFRFRRYGQSGLDFSEIFEKTAQHADDICVIRSMYCNTPNHEQSMRLMNTGDERLSRPSFGSWLLYGMGTDNQNLPGFIAMCPGLPVSDVSNWRSSFLPGAFQGTYIDTRRTKVDELIDNIRNPALSQPAQRRQLDLLAALNRRHQQSRAEDAGLEARIESFELAFRMQTAATDAFDVSREPKHIQEMYGPGVQARQMLIARRLVERGVRCVQLYHGDVQPWDAHSHLEQNHRELARPVRPADRRPAHRSQAARPVGRDPGACAAASSAARPPSSWARRAPAIPCSAATTIIGASASGWPAAASKAE